MAAVTAMAAVAALSGVSVDIPEGSLVTMLGPSGCGKSTLLRAIADLVPVSAGEITVLGRSPEIARRDRNKSLGQPTAYLYHVISNVRITFPKPDEAVHYSYWQTVRRDAQGAMVAAAMGRSEDRLVRRNGKWLIQSRKLTVFSD